MFAHLKKIADIRKPGLSALLLLLLSLLLITSSCSAHSRSTGEFGAKRTERLSTVPEMTDRGTWRKCLPKDCLALALDAKEQGKWAESIELLNELRATWPGTLEAARGALLLALFKIEETEIKSTETAKSKRDRTEANATKKSASGGRASGSRFALDPGGALKIDAVKYLYEAKALGDIEEYVDLYLARALSSAGETKSALKLINSRLDQYRDRAYSQALIPTLLYEQASLYRALGRRRAEFTSLTKLTNEYASHKLAPTALLAAARLAWALNDPVGAHTLAHRIRIFHAGAPEAIEAEKVLEWLAFVDIPLNPPTAAMRFTRAQKLYRAAMFKEVHVELKSILEIPGIKERDRELYTEAMLLKGLTLFRQKRYTKTIKSLKESLGELTDEKRPDALYWIALTAQRLERADILEDALSELNSTPERKERAWALLFFGRLYEKLGDFKRARHYFEQVIEQYDSRPAMHASWHIAWKSYMKGDYEEARRVLTGYLDGMDPASARAAGFLQEDQERFNYWSARSAEKLGLITVKSTEAARGYYAACGDRESTYYCQMATERLAGLGLPAPGSITGAANRAETDRTTGTLEAHRGYRTARELITLGLTTEAAEELDILAKSLRKSHKQRPEQIPEQIKEIASLFHASGDYYRGLKVYNRYYYLMGRSNGTGGADGRPENIAFPMGIVERITGVDRGGNNKKSKTDPLLVASIMREESTFNPEAISYSGALGLMQIMPGTGDFIAMKLRTRPPARAELLAPDTNIRYGAWYLGYLAERFNNNLVLTIAGYNAGPSAAAKWSKDKKLKRLSRDEFIESIPYTETRRYTKRVLRSYTEYLKAAGLDPATRFTRPLTAYRAPQQKRVPVKERTQS